MWFHDKAYRVVCVGSAAKDIFFPTDQGLILSTPEDITAKEKIAFELGGKYRVDDRYEAVGGVAANVSQGLSRLGHRVACYSQVGDDEIGRYVLQNLKKEGVALEALAILPHTKTDLSAIIVAMQTGERTIFHNRDANEKLTIDEKRLPEAEWLFISSLNGDWKANLRALLALKEKRGVQIALNPGQHNIKDDAELMLEAVAAADVLLLNKDEALELLLRQDPERSKAELEREAYLLKELHAIGAKVIGLTDGKRGGWAYDGEALWHAEIHMPFGLVDTTGAGDAFGSGFFAALLSSLPLDQALAYGIGNGGSVVGAYGASEKLLRPDQMTEVVKNVHPTRL